MSCMIFYKDDAIGKICLALARHLTEKLIELANSDHGQDMNPREFHYAPLQPGLSWVGASEHLDMAQYKAPSLSLPDEVDLDKYTAFVVLAANLEPKCVEQLVQVAGLEHDVSLIGVERALADNVFDNVLYITPDALTATGHNAHDVSLYLTTFDLLVGLYNTFVKEHSPGPLLSVSVARILADEELRKQLEEINDASVAIAGQRIIDQYSIADKLNEV